jgi:energy-coupling factor transporter ATP-binding protein EcfA2
MLNNFMMIFDWLLKILLVVLIPVYPLLLSMLLFFIGYTFVFFKRGKHFRRRFKHKKRNILLRLYIDFPRRFWLDQFERDPNEFKESGLHLFCGEQGSGKTTAVVHMLMKMKEEYPKSKIRTNFDYNRQDSEVCQWRELVRNENGIFGQVEVIDEIQTWFASMQSRDFPPEMLTEISQQRKQRKMLVGTAQVFGRVAKPIREQVTKVYCPMTLWGCLMLLRYTYRYRFRTTAVTQEAVLFISNKGEAMTDTSVCQMFRRVRTRLNIPRLHAHLLRHTFATNFLLAGLGDIYQLAQLLGHEDIKTTLIYLHAANYYSIIRKGGKNTYMDVTRLSLKSKHKTTPV